MPQARQVLAVLSVLLLALVAAVSAPASCEGAPTSLKTSLSGGGKEGEEITVVEGTAIKDKATLSGENASKATGTVKYNVYSENKCKELVAKAGEVSVKGGVVPASEEVKLTAGAIYYWQAVYSGDFLNEASSSTCGKEVAAVKATTSLKTSLSGGGKEGEEITVVEGTAIKDNATLSGTNASKATGTVKYNVYSDSKCEKLVTKAGEVSVSGGSVPASEEKKLEAGAVYYWQAAYSGDSLHEASSSPCGKEVAIVKATTSLTTLLWAEGESYEEVNVQEEVAVKDNATLSGTNASKATGTVKYNVYSDSKCEELATKAGEVSVEGGKVPSSSEVKLLVGIYYWQAAYSGDSLHEASTSACGTEIQVVAEDTSLTTLLLGEGEESGEEIETPEGTPIRDSATLSGTYASEATGTVEYFVYSDKECKELVAEAGEVSVEGESVPPSGSVALPVGTYYWQAVYSGDSSNKASTSACGTEIATITAPAITTLLSGEEQLGTEIEVPEETAVTDTATLHGENASKATGTVEYNVYSDEECKELVAKAGEVSVEGEKVPSSSVVKLKTGTYYWQAVYSGDEENPPATSACGVEIEVVVEETSLTTSLLIEGEEAGPKIEVQEGVPVSDTATLSGTYASKATGAVEYSVYADEGCEELVAHAGSASVEGEEVPASDELMLPTGTYYWQAVYFGDSSNKGSTSACGAEVEKVTVAPVTTSLSGGGKSGTEIEVPEETAVTDTATLHGENASKATGTVEYNVYSDEECKELVAKAGEVSVEGEKVPSSSVVKLKTGTYYWQAVYSGDEENPAAASICGIEVQRVMEPWIVSVGDSYISGEGGRWAGNVRSNFMNSQAIDALGATAYKNPLNGEGAGEAIERCHRSRSAEIFIQRGVRALNLACSGAETTSASQGVRFFRGALTKKGVFKPGLDFANATFRQEILPGRGRCALAACKGQARMLQEFAQARFNNQEKIKMVVLSIGGNDFGFGDVIVKCALAFESPTIFGPCNVSEQARFEAPAAAARRAEIENGIRNIGIAMENAGYVKAEYTILVQDYPSPIPEAAGDFRYPEASFKRHRVGGCPILNVDAAWANATALKTINETVKTAAANVNAVGTYDVKFLELGKAFIGRRLCEKGLALLGQLEPPRIPRWTVPTAVDQTEWINQIRIITGLSPFFQQEGMHPNFWGQLALRNCVRKAFNNGAPLGGKECLIEGLGLEPRPARSPDWLQEPKMKLN